MRKKQDGQVTWWYKFGLSSSKPDDVYLNGILTKLADHGEAAEWIRRTLVETARAREHNDPIMTPQNAATLIPGIGGKTVQVPAHSFHPVPKPGSSKKPAQRKDEDGEDFKP